MGDAIWGIVCRPLWTPSGGLCGPLAPPNGGRPGFVVADDLCYRVVFVGLGVFVESGEGVGVDMSVILKSGM